MGDTSVTKVSSARSPKGAMGQKYLASGIHIATRMDGMTYNAIAAWAMGAQGGPRL